MALHKGLQQDKEEFITLLNDYKILFQIVEEDILKRGNMLITLGTTNVYFEEDKENMMVEKKNFTPINAELVNTSKKMRLNTNVNTQKRIDVCFQ